MDIRVIGSTDPEFQLSVDAAKLFAGHSAGICYMKDDFNSILAEPEEKTLKRFEATVGSGHHSVSGHVSYNLLLVGIPKIIAMILNNENDYNTSEKSARYTQMEVSGKEKYLYNKWLDIFKKLIERRYPMLDEKTRLKLAQENARYFISVFTPSTIMEYTVDFRQGNYLIGFMEDVVNDASTCGDPFMDELRPYLWETAQLFRRVLNCEGIRDNKGRELSLFANRYKAEHFGETYVTNYTASFAMVAQAQRHRTLDYEIMIPPLHGAEFYIPPIIDDSITAHEYYDDMESVRESYPQGMLVHVCESGKNVKHFLSKAEERLCGCAQLEICLNTRETLERYYNATANDADPYVHNLLGTYIGKTKCQFGHYKCDRPCPLGQKNVFTRKI